MKNLHDFVDSILKNGGATFNLVTGTAPTSGFIVAEKGFEKSQSLFGGRVSREILTHALVKQFISENGMELNNPENFLGGWIEGKKLVLDISRVYDNEHDALRIAVENEQRAYYNINDDKTVEL
jgi:hypothetical protein